MNCRQVDLSWVASGGSGLKVYIIHRSDGIESTIVATHTTFSDAKRVTPSSALTYTVSAMDFAGNESASSNAVSVTTPACSGNEHGVGDFEGKLEISVEDHAGGESRTLYFLQTGKDRFPIHFTMNPRKRFLSGTPVYLKAGLVDGELAASGDSSIQILALDPTDTTGASDITTATSPVLPNTFGEQKTLVVLVNFLDNPSQPSTPEFIQNLVFTDISNFYRENSFQQTWLSGDVLGWYTIPVLSTTCDTPSIESEGKKAAAAAGVNLSLYTRFVYLFPRTNACTWAGLAWVGGVPSRAFINGVFTLRVIGHEYGHTFGLLHSHGLDCDTSALGTSCSSIEYGDGADIMGGREAHFNSYQKEDLGWLNGALPPIITVLGTGNYTLDPYESSSMNPKALKILKSTDPMTGLKTWYYIEYRQPLGFDNILNGVGNLVSGVEIRTGTEQSGGSYLLDMTPNTSVYSDLDDGALAVGSSFNDSAAGVTITTQWANGTGAGVNVTLAQPCVRTQPSVSISPSQSSSIAGTPIVYTVGVTNNDSSVCGSSTFNLQASLPSGWTGTFAAPALGVNAGRSSSTTFTVTSPPSTASGSCTISVTATNGSNNAFSGTAFLTYSVVAILNDAVWTDKSSYAKGDTITITSSTTAAGQAIANASVTLTVTKPNGATVAQTVTTKANGQAVYRLRLSKKDPAGTYKVRATASSNGQTAVASTSFTVH